MTGRPVVIAWYWRHVENETPSKPHSVVIVMIIVLCMRTSKVIKSFLRKYPHHNKDASVMTTRCFFLESRSTFSSPPSHLTYTALIDYA